MAQSNKELACLIVDYLSRVSETKQVSEEYIDSLNVAVDCITEAFELEQSSVGSTLKNAFEGRKLEQIVGSSVGNATESASPSASTIVPEAVKVNIPPQDAATKAKAETLKLEGNKAMAAKDFELAVQKYSEAIEVLPSNAVYYANRAAAHSSLKKYQEAVQDADSAIRVNPSYSKGYSRLGFAQYALGKPEEALDAYKKVLDIEGENATDAMKRDYDTAMKKVEQSLHLEKSSPASSSVDNAGTPAGGAGGAGGFPDISSMLSGGLGGLLNNPQVMQAAQQMMQNPGALGDMMNNPAIKQMAEKFQSGNGTPNMADMMKDPALMDMAKNMFGGGAKE
ncbi:LANO_0A06700g1_1 [Lachancea nothofagi CBS 11611]|uniref:LANO_0A06700g1_1 n=1 Tax=Lachancea nothofagi CBS 11611 TaxID=1266666 RepID=A0A1G4IRS2_9SACH|nr:LANO_0A06700g1_1 [Lachancea nothofagi CBS 11611]